MVDQTYIHMGDGTIRGSADGRRYIRSGTRMIDVTSHGDDLDPGVVWAIKHPQAAEDYVRRMHPGKYFLVDLWAYLKSEWAKPLWGTKHE